MDGFTLPPDRETFVRDSVARGRFRDVDAVVRSGATLDAALAEGERDGFVTIDEVAAELKAIIAEAEEEPAFPCPYRVSQFHDFD